MHHYIRTYTGKTLNPLRPRPEDIDIRDIAHALSLNCRFCGQCKWHYSVGQHSILCATKAPSHLKLEALLHDASEAYISDLAKPVKVQDEMHEYREAERRLEEVIALRFGLRYPLPEGIHHIDQRMLATEIRDLMPDDEPLRRFPYDDVRIEKWKPGFTEHLFIATYDDLAAQRRMQML